VELELEAGAGGCWWLSGWWLWLVAGGWWLVAQPVPLVAPGAGAWLLVTGYWLLAALVENNSSLRRRTCRGDTTYFKQASEGGKRVKVAQLDLR
jgi:hypothetical protein